MLKPDEVYALTAYSLREWHHQGIRRHRRAESAKGADAQSR